MPPIRRCAWCKRAPRWDDPLRSVQVNAEDAAPQTIEFIVGLWGKVETGTMQGGTCRKCAAKLMGEPEPPPIRYGPDNPGKPGVEGQQADGRCAGDSFPICGCCRQALYEDDTTVPMRIMPDDLDVAGFARGLLESHLATGNKPEAKELCARLGVPMPGAMQSCRECQAIYRPRILARHHLAGRFLEVTDPWRMSRGMLL